MLCQLSEKGGNHYVYYFCNGQQHVHDVQDGLWYLNEQYDEHFKFCLIGYIQQFVMQLRFYYQEQFTFNGCRQCLFTE